MYTRHWSYGNSVVTVSTLAPKSHTRTVAEPKNIKILDESDPNNAHNA